MARTKKRQEEEAETRKDLLRLKRLVATRIYPSDHDGDERGDDPDDDDCGHRGWHTARRGGGE